MSNGKNYPSVPPISVLILSFNRCQELRTTLTRLRSIEYPAFEIIVIDNASHDGTAAMVTSEFPFVTLITLEKNIGIAGWNEGMKIARGDYFLCLDDDSYPLPDLFAKSLPYFSPDTILAFKIVTPAGDWETPFFEGKFQKCSFIGCGALIPRKVYESIGGYNPSLFLYHHEMEYAIRAIDKGFSIRYLEEARVCHLRAKKNRDLQNEIDWRFFYYMTRNSIIILLLHFSFVHILGRLFRIIAGRILFALVHNNLSVAVTGVYDGFAYICKHWNTRSVVSDQTQKFYEYGKYLGSFFADGKCGFKRPKWM